MAEEKQVKRIQQKALQMRRNIIEMGYTAKDRGAHFGPALSSVEIIASLYFGAMHHDPLHPEMNDRDRFVQSKGHACLAYYAALVEAGYIAREQMYTFKQDGSFLSGHPSRNLRHGIEISSGSLGNGFSIACGMAKGAKMRQMDHTVFCLVGDGECNEGLVWESAMNAAKNRLDNLVAIVDRNGVQLAGKTCDIMDFDIEAVWKAFGWDVMTVSQGNEVDVVLEALLRMKQTREGKPHVIITDTVKGKGISFMEDSLDWHARAMGSEHYEMAIGDLDAATGRV